MMLGGIKIFKGNNFKDKRGYIWTSWLNKKYRINFIQDKFSLSKKNVFRELHYDEISGQTHDVTYAQLPQHNAQSYDRHPSITQAQR